MICKLCGSNRITRTEISRGKHYLLFCKDCGLGFVDPIPSKNEIKEYYNKYLNEKGYKYLSRGLREYKIKNIWQERYKIISRHIDREKDLYFLEVGVGTGEWFEVLENKRIKNNFGIEISKDELKILKNKYGSKIKDVELLSYRNKQKFDVVCLWDVLEHLPTLTRSLKRIKEMLNKDGVVIFSVPNTDSWSWYLKKEKWKYFSPPEHIFYFNKKSVNKMAKLFDFSLLYYKTSVQLQAYLYDNDCDVKIGNIDMRMYRVKRSIEKIFDKFIFNRGEIITFILQKNE